MRVWRGNTHAHRHDAQLDPAHLQPARPAARIGGHGLLHYASHERCRAGQGPTATGVHVCPAVSVHGLSHHARRGREGPAGDVDGVLPGAFPGGQEHGFHRLAGAPVWEDEGEGGGAREQDRGEWRRA